MNKFDVTEIDAGATRMMPYVFDDGGRKEAGFKGNTEDCSTRAIAIATGLSYREVYDELNLLAKKERPRKRKRSSARTGVWPKTVKKYMASIGWEWVAYTKIGVGCTAHLVAEELPRGSLIARVSKHYTAVVNGTIRDIWNPQREPPRQVYGIFREVAP